jgi:glycine/D-amino acid oxidase-like deaminating enzyme
MSLSNVGGRAWGCLGFVRVTSSLGFTASFSNRFSGGMSNLPVWAEQLPAPLPALRGSIAADVCVVGMGGSGLACIRELVTAGCDVVALDAGGIAAGAAGRNGGFLLGGLALFHHDAVQRLGRAAAVAIYDETLKEIDRMARETPNSIRRTGTLRIAASADELIDCRQQLAAMRRDGLPVELYDGPQGRGLLFPRDTAFDPVQRCRTLAEWCVGAGARLFERSPVVAIGAGCVRTSDGEVRAPTVVVAVDGGLEVLLPELAPRVRTARLQMLATAPAPDVQWRHPVYSRWGLDYWQQLPDGRIVLGGCRDVGGDAEWTMDAVPTDVVQSALTRILRAQLGITATVTHRWAATVAYTGTGLPVVEQVRPGVWALGAYSGTGNVIGALCGRAVAEQITRGNSRLLELLRA